ncbi:MAG: hypothetical protein RQ743_03990 [Bacteroidales bacterium]|nr:hypothetical protein [Bacteroidales bacterium]
MKNKTVLIILLLFLIMPSCIKETYDMDKLSGEVALNPTWVLRAVKGELSLADLVEPNDTVVFDENKLVKLVFREDSIFEYRLDDFYTPFTVTSFENTMLVTANLEPDGSDTLVFEPEDDIKIKKMMISSGLINYSLRSWCSFDVIVDLEVPAVVNGTVPFTLSETVAAGSTVNGSADLSGSLASFDIDPEFPYNRVPVEWTITVLSPPGSYAPSDSVRLFLEVEEPDFDYATGYFGYLAEESGKDTLDLGMEELFSKLSGSIFLASPSITMNYDNSFGLPMRIDAEVKGMDDEGEISLDRDPVDLDFPTSIDDRDVNSSFTIDKSNSNLPELISMLPYKIEFLASASINPEGETGTDNIIFGDSRFIASMEAVIPMDLRINNLQLSDTTENFLRSDDPEEENPLEMLEEMKFDLYVENGFPLDASVTIELYDSNTMTVLETINTGELIQAAPVDASGKVTGPSITTVEVEVTSDFIGETEDADRIILTFTLNTTDDGSRDVKIYSDYNLVFAAVIKLKAGINLNFNSEEE